MDAERFLDNIRDDEGLTSGLADPEAGMLLDWLMAEVRAAASTLSEEQQVWDFVGRKKRRARLFAKTIEAASYGEDPDAVARLWSNEPLRPDLEEWDVEDPAAGMRRLIEWEKKQDA